MAASAPFLHGPLATHPKAEKFAAEVHRVHRRYATEVVAKHRLCPHLRDVDRDFGDFVIMLDPRPEPDVEATVAAILASENQVIHVVFPLVRPPPSLFERFGARVSAALKKALPKPPVMATFHPALVGDGGDPHRLVGLLRRAPDPFVQMIPDGFQEGGTVFVPLSEAAAMTHEKVDWPQRNFDKLRGENLERLLALVADIQADRDRSYGPFVAAMGI
jgi:hypothetical protein